MAWLGFIAAGIFLLYFFTRKSSDPANAAPPPITPTSRPAFKQQNKTPPDDIEFLKARWTEAQREKDSSATSTFPHWFHEDATEKQLAMLAKYGMKISGSSLTKGAASDLIGLSMELEEDDAEVLKFFNVSIRGMNQTRGRYAVKALMADPTNAEAWEAKPASRLQKECLKFFSITLPRALSAKEADKLIKEFRSHLDEQQQEKWEQWQLFESLTETLSDKETCDDYDIKKPNLTTIRDAVESLRAEGKTMDELDTHYELVIERIVKLKPELVK